MNSARHSPNNLAKLGISTVVAVREPTGSIFCQFKGHKCTRDKVATERFCLRHLALQRDSAIKQCNYVSAKSSIRCSNRVERNDCNKDGLCLQHSRKISSVKRKVAKKQRRRNSDFLKWQSVAHYSSFPNPRVGGYDNKADYHSESSDSEEFQSPMTIENEAEEISDDDFDRPDEPLKRAGIYTADEITMITRDKLLRLQSLYMEEIQKLQQLYVKRKSFYAPLIRGEETSIDIKSELILKGKEESKAIRKLEALQNYRRITGVEKLMKKRWARVKPSATKMKCKEPECHEQPLISSRYCYSHVLQDKSQLLFRKCTNADCTEVFMRFTGSKLCRLHEETQPATG